MMRTPFRSHRQETIRALEQEYSDLLDEERCAPHHHEALTAWVLANTLSGERSYRDKRKCEIERDIFLAKCGYRLLALPPSRSDPTGRVCTLMTLDLPYRVVGRITREYLRHMPPGAQAWPMILYQLADGNIHVACNVCSEPLLQRKNTDLALKLLTYSTGPALILRDDGTFERDRAFYEKVDAAIVTEYRTVVGGPESSPILHCPGCRTLLEKETVEVIGQ